MTSTKRLGKNSEQVKELCEQYEKKIQLVKIEEKPVPIAPVEPRIVVKNPKLQEISRDDVSFHPFCLNRKDLTFNYSTLKVTSSGEETIGTFHCICQEKQQDN